MVNIHPTALVDPEVVLADDVEIGAFCILRGKIEIGPGCVIMDRVSMQGPLKIGANNTFYPNCIIGKEPQDHKFTQTENEPGVMIGKHNTFREGFTIHRATHDTIPTTVNNHNLFMVNSHIGHDCKIGSNITMVNGSLCAGHVTLEDKVILSGNAGIHQFCTLGRMSMISGNQGVTQDLPPFCICYSSRSVGSLNIVGLRRAGYSKHIDNLKKAFKICFLSNYTNKRKTEMIMESLGHDPLCKEFADFIASSKRGLTQHYTRIGSKYL